MLAVGANGTAIMAALPTMQTELSLSAAGVQWAVNAYLVASAACIVLGGQAADRFGARWVSVIGLALFGIASCIIATAGTQMVLLAGRALQGFAAALMSPVGRLLFVLVLQDQRRVMRAFNGWPWRKASRPAKHAGRDPCGPSPASTAAYVRGGTNRYCCLYGPQEGSLTLPLASARRWRTMPSDEVA